MPRNPRICIILVNWNGLKDTIECLESIQKVDYKLFSTIVIDNGSTDGSPPILRERFRNVPVFETGENLGFAGGNNVGIEWALEKPFEWILLLNNDTIVDPNFLKAFVEASRQKPEGKIFGAKIYRYGEPQKIDHCGGTWNPKIGDFESNWLGKLDDGASFEEMKRVDYVCGAALFMHRSVPETIGPLEPKFFLFWEETDFCYRAQRMGFEVWTAPQAKIWHKVSASFSGGKPHSHYFWWRSRLLWIERNLPYAEKQKLMKEVVRPDLLKLLRHTLLKTPLSPLKKTKRLRAGLLGVLHYYLGRFGNCPRWIYTS
jgi:GT2 family glycosyltransferase